MTKKVVIGIVCVLAVIFLASFVWHLSSTKNDHDGEAMISSETEDMSESVDPSDVDYGKDDGSTEAESNAASGNSKDDEMSASDSKIGESGSENPVSSEDSIELPIDVFEDGDNAFGESGKDDGSQSDTSSKDTGNELPVDYIE